MALRTPLLLLLTLPLCSLVQAERVSKTYKKFCASCHGDKLQGGLGPSLVDDKWLNGNSADAVRQSIENGNLTNGMPAFKEGLSAEQIRGLVIYLEEQANRAQHSSAGQLEKGLVQAQDHAFSLTEIAQFDGIAWAVEQLPDQSFLVTLRDKELWHVTGQEKRQIKGLPDIWRRGQGGLLDVALHPDFPRQEWVYLTYSISSGLMSGMTTLARGKVKDGKWQQHQELFNSDEDDHTSRGVHFGSRIIFKDQQLYFSIGDRGKKAEAQMLDKPNGKVHRLNLDGSIPADNPYPKAKYPSIWSYGHRNPQGLTLNPASGEIWSVEHGPRGGDELNLIQKGLNYGWPKITYGMNYNGTPMTAKTAQPGMEQPIVYWVPSLAVSAVTFYQGQQFPNWKNSLLVASLAAEELRLLKLKGERVTSQETLLKDQGRIRDVIQGQNGDIYLTLEDRATDTSRLVRLTPQK